MSCPNKRNSPKSHTEDKVGELEKIVFDTDSDAEADKERLVFEPDSNTEDDEEKIVFDTDSNSGNAEDDERLVFDTDSSAVEDKEKLVFDTDSNSENYDSNVCESDLKSKSHEDQRIKWPHSLVIAIEMAHEQLCSARQINKT